MEQLENSNLEKLSTHAVTVPTHKAPSHANVRCPDCLKLYSVRITAVQSRKPEFECTGCKTRFWMLFPECLELPEVVGFPCHIENPVPAKEEASTLNVVSPALQESEKIMHSVDEKVPVSPPRPPINQPTAEFKKAPLKVRSDNSNYAGVCPKCAEPRVPKSTECGHCGIVYKKFEFLEEPGRPKTSHQLELNSFWEQVLTDYESQELHDRFIGQCKQRGQLDYAAYKYKNVFDTNPSDDIAEGRLKQIDAIALVEQGLALESQKKRPAQKPYFRWTTFAVVLGVMMMVLGFGFMQFRNLIGIGVALTFLSLTLSLYFK